MPRYDGASLVEPVATHDTNMARRPDVNTTKWAQLMRRIFVRSQVHKKNGLSAIWAIWLLTKPFLLFREPIKRALDVENVLARQLQFALPNHNPCFHANNTSVTPKTCGANGWSLSAKDWRSGAYAWRSGLVRLEDCRSGAYAWRSGLGW